ncbi:MAG: hypothetical protein QXL46_03325 [Nitrososphaerales archaeon]
MKWLDEYQDVSKAFGEVASSSQMGFTIQAYKYGYEYTPEYGSIVVVNCGKLLTVGVVVASEMTPAPGLSAIPTPMRATREEVAERYPDLEGRLLDIYKAVSIGYYIDGRFFYGRPKRKPLIHDLSYLPSDEFIKEFHKSSGEYTLDYFPLILHALDKGEINPLADVYFAYLAEKFKDDERAQLYESFSASLVKWGDEALIAEMINLARRRLMEAST